MKLPLKVVVILLAFFSTALAVQETDNGFQPGEHQPGGEATHKHRFDKNSFSHASENINFEQELNFKVGNGFFRRVWVSSPSSTQAALTGQAVRTPLKRQPLPKQVNSPLAQICGYRRTSALVLR